MMQFPLRMPYLTTPGLYGHALTASTTVDTTFLTVSNRLNVLIMDTSSLETPQRAIPGRVPPRVGEMTSPGRSGRLQSRQPGEHNIRLESEHACASRPTFTEQSYWT